jgi:hypothetical protein
MPLFIWTVLYLAWVEQMFGKEAAETTQRLMLNPTGVETSHAKGE